MSAVRKCAECNAEVDGETARCSACEAKYSNSQNGMLATVDHSPSSQGVPTRPGEMPESGQSFGEYRVVRQLGKGGMGSVFEAEEVESGRRVALKLFGQSLDSTDAKKRFIREGRLAASISHPNTVYVYGTEEINGIPTISMELVAGGTLEAKIRESGPMPVGKAVDTILQVIDGLEAAEKLGVLHRDIKPSNCFLDANGSVKVGDFGLSVSTIAKTDLKLTTTGSFLGTPSYASPEQLRGQTMDLRSDIYSVGVTLYYLLTGKIPFEADSFVQLIAAVLEQPTPSAAQVRKEVPRELAAVVSRCLDKQPAKRFQTYADLRAALQPFTSVAPVAAGIPLRMLAGILDSCVLFVCSLIQMSIASSVFGANPFDPQFFGSRTQVVIYVISASWTIAYFAVTEALWGATIGKALCGIRVIDAKRGHPSFLPALIRSVIYYIAPCLPTWIFIGFRPPVTNASTFDLFPIALALAIYPMLAILFITARKRNGYAALQDLASGTRVIMRPETDARPVGVYTTPPAHVSGGPSETIGPYRVIEQLDADWRLGFDDKLGRNVWIRLCSPMTPPLASVSGNVARTGRLRWLGGKREAKESWDAFEAASGAPFREVITTARSWESVRYWLADLAQELTDAEKDGTTPATLSLDRVWITSDNRAKLLDLPTPRAKQPETPLKPDPDSPIDDRARQLLSVVATSALLGRELNSEAAKTAPITTPLPLHASSLLSEIRRLAPLQSTSESLRNVLKKRVEVTRIRRLALVAACLAFPLVTALFPVLIHLYLMQWEESMPNVKKIHALMQKYAYPPFLASNRPKLAPEAQSAIEIVIASKYAADIQNPLFWNTLYAQSTIPSWEKEAALKIIKEHKPSSGDELAKAEAEVEAMLRKNPLIDPLKRVHPLMYFVMMLIGSVLFYAALPAWIAAVGFRGGLILAMLGIVVVDRNGRQASRWRMAWRTIVAWGAIPLLPFLVLFLMLSLGQAGAAGIGLLLFIGPYLLSSLLPVRGIPDRLAGTYLVMK